MPELSAKNNTDDMLYVKLYDVVIGILQKHHRGFTFQATDEGIEHFGLGSAILGLSVPLLPHLPNRSQNRYQNFFEELIPEGTNRELLEKSISLSKGSTFEILRRFGRDIAGAIEIYDEQNSTPKEPFHKLLMDEEIRVLLESITTLPFANDEYIGKTSLAGVQKKIVLALLDGKWNQVFNGFPSTHILKPALPTHPTMIYDELYGMQLAQKVGISNVGVRIENFAGLDALVIDRYDREYYSNCSIKRIHQEDFNQILCASGNEKYQEISGKVTLKRIAGYVDKLQKDELVQLAKYVLYAYLIGDLDMHAKNISVLHPLNQAPTLAPKYDAVPLLHQNTDGKMALAVSGEYFYSNLTKEHFVNEFLEWGLTEDVLQITIDSLITKTSSCVLNTNSLSLHPKANQNIVDNILSACNVLKG